VLGLPRSGTTLAEAVLGAHPKVVALGERAAAGALLSTIINEDLPFDADAVDRFNEGDRRLLPDLPPDVVAYVDKMPENYRLIGFLLTAQPHCRIVHVRRDPRDVALSMWRGHFQGTALNYTYDLGAMTHRFNLFARMMAHWNAVFPGRVLEIRYEDMARNLEATGRHMADFCGLDWHPKMGSPEEHAGQVLTLSALQLRQPVHARSIGKWKAHAEELAPFIEGLEPGHWPELA
ncbi:sulfotransferase, partial [Cribrihabitans sp. XS_ASV171]